MADVLIVAVSLALLVGYMSGYFLGYRVGSGPCKEERAQRELERRVTGRTRTPITATSEPAVIRSARLVRSNSWRSSNNGK